MQPSNRPAWMNWAALAIFLWATWNLSSYWYETFRGS